MTVTFCDICTNKIGLEQDMVVQIFDLVPGEGSETPEKHTHQHFHQECMQRVVNKVPNIKEVIKEKTQ